MFTVNVPTTVSLYRVDATHFAPIHVGTWILSIQASVDHHCIPQKNFPNDETHMYSHFEVLIMTSNFEAIDPEEIHEFPKYLLDYWDGSTFNDVPIIHIQRIMDFISKN